jgi:hypothetical protein
MSARASGALRDVSQLLLLLSHPLLLLLAPEAREDHGLPLLSGLLPRKQWLRWCL